jgi:hypothetical protein
MTTAKYEGSCFCGSVRLTATGQPAAMGYCHCMSCRHWSAGPVNAFTLWNMGQIEIVAGAANIGTYNKTERSFRKWCNRCGGHLLIEHPLWQLIDVPAALLPGLSFQPGLHVNYAEHVLAMADALPKQRDLPREMGGSGELVSQ